MQMDPLYGGYECVLFWIHTHLTFYLNIRSNSTSEKWGITRSRLHIDELLFGWVTVNSLNSIIYCILIHHSRIKCLGGLSFSLRVHLASQFTQYDEYAKHLPVWCRELGHWDCKFLLSKWINFILHFLIECRLNESSQNMVYQKSLGSEWNDQTMTCIRLLLMGLIGASWGFQERQKRNSHSVIFMSISYLWSSK